MTSDWFAGAPDAMQAVATPIFAVLVTALLVFGAMAMYRMATGKSIGRDEDE